MHETLQLAVTLGFAAFLAWLWARRAQAQAELQRLRLEGRNQLLARFDDLQALLAFTNTEPGRTLFALSNEPPEGSAKHQPEGLRLIQAGIVVLFVGLGFRETYYVAMNWRAANVRLDEMAAFGQAVRLWQWSQIGAWSGVALILCGLLAAWLAWRDRTRDAKD